MNVGGAQNEYAQNGTGPYSHPGQYVYNYVCSTGLRCSNPDVMIGSAVGGFFPIAGNPTVLSTQVSTATPKVQSTLKLISSNPFSLVNITQDTYGFPQDLKAEIYGFRLIRQWLSTAPASSLVGTEVIPGTQYQTDEELATWIKANTNAKWHWVGSAKFGNRGDSTRVTDPQLRVVGIKGLRVGDGSVYPTVNTHAQASIAVAGERVADFILRDAAQADNIKL